MKRVRILPVLSVLFLGLFLLSSCSNDDLFETVETSNSKIKVYLKNDKLHFDSKESLEEIINLKKDKFKGFVRNFQNHDFRPLSPIFEENEIDKLDAYLLRKSAKMKKGISLYTKVATVDDNLDTEDELILDSNFAALLNENREVYVGDKIYVYTTKGLFFSNIENEKHLKEYLKTLDFKIKNGENSKVVEPCLEDEPIQSHFGKAFSNESITQIDEEISLFTDCGDGGFGGGGSGGSGNNTNDKFAFEKRQDFRTCVIRGESVWQQIFGDAETCHDYFESKKRVKVKFYNQNYFVFSSIGSNVKYQQKYWLGWKKSNAVDYTELGINFAEFTYSLPTPSFNAVVSGFTETIIKYKGKIYKTNGQILNDFPIQVPNWPFDNDENFIEDLQILFFNINLTGKDLNKQVNKLIRDQLKNTINGLRQDLDANKIAIKVINNDIINNKVRFMVVNRLERDVNDGAVRHNLDFNFFIKLKIKEGNVSSVNVFNGKDYEDLKIDFYGMASRGGETNFRGIKMISENLE